MWRFLPAWILVATALHATAQTPAVEQPDAVDNPPLVSVPVPRERPDFPPPPASPADNNEPAPDQTPERADDVDERIYQTACPALLAGRIEARALPPIADDSCRIRSPLSVTAVSANGRTIPFTSEATLTCGMAGSVSDWAASIDGYLQARENTGLAAIITGTSYACRNRNNADDGPISEHGFGNALDVVGFELVDGRTLSLPDGWALPNAPAGRLLRFAHDAACARFTTTLGPEANAAHADHLHVDLGCHGASCTSRLCE